MKKDTPETRQGGTIHARQRKKQRRSPLLTLPEIVSRHLQRDDGSRLPNKTATKRPLARRALRVCLWVLITPLMLITLLVGALACITSPMAEPALTDFIEQTINDACAPMGMQIHIDTITGLWDGELRVLNLRVHDPHGPWLHVHEATLHPSWESLIYGARALIQAHQGHAITTQELNSPVSHNIVTNTDHYQTDLDSVITRNTQDEEEKKIEQTQLSHDIMDNLLTAQELLRDKVVLGLRDGTIIGVRMPRFPRLTTASNAPETSKEALTPLSFLPTWLALDIGELEISNFLLGPVGRNVYISARAHGQLTREAARIRSTVMLEKNKPKQWALPATQDLPGDVTLTIKELRNSNGMATAGSFQNLRELGEKKLIAFLSFDAKKANFDMRWRVRDELVSRYYLPGISRIWSRMRILGHIPSWPPTPQHPLHAAIAARFGATFATHDNTNTASSQRLKASMASMQIVWNGDSLIVRDLNIISPIKTPFMNLSASLGASEEQGLGAVISLKLKDITPLAQAFSTSPNSNDIQGAVNMTFTALRSGEHLMWWTKPLPPVQKGRTLPGFTQSPKDFSVLGKQLGIVVTGIHKTLATIAQHNGITRNFGETRLPPPSSAPMSVQLKVESPLLQTPQGNMKDVYVSIRGESVRAKDATGGTGQQKTDDGKKFVSDFSARGIPQGLVGTTRVRIGDMFSMGTGTLEGRWFVGGLHEKAAVFLADLENFTLKLPGIDGVLDMGFAYALPVVKRRWPWMDGSLSLHVDHWRLIAELMNSPLRGNDVGFTSSLKSFLDTNGKPQQFFTAQIEAQRLDATQFMVQDVYGVIESKYVHALADVLALMAGPLWQAKLKKLDYNVPDGAELLSSSLNLANGRSGSFRWNWGSYFGNVHGEAAQFSIKMNGDIDASLDGSFNFRKRLLSVGKMQLKTLNK